MKCNTEMRERFSEILGKISFLFIASTARAFLTSLDAVRMVSGSLLSTTAENRPERLQETPPSLSGKVIK